MTAARLAELAGAFALLGGGLWPYPRRSPDRYGSQGAVLVFAIGAIVLIHALGLLDYRPSARELAFAQERGQ
jgi:hypothetical protein